MQQFQLRLEVLAKSGAIVSSAGIGLLIVFVVTLLAYPVIKECEGNDKCSYTSMAPEQLKAVIQPSFLAVSFMIISGGVLMVRLSRWKVQKEGN